MPNLMPLGQTHPNQIRLVVGLGNPGPEYAGTRHNIGFMVVDQLAAQVGSTWAKSTKWDALTSKHGDTLLTKPMSFMNRSGYPLVAIAQFYKIATPEILVVLDDLALPLGRVRIRPSGGTGGHNGLESIITQFGTEEIPRLRIGIGAAPRELDAGYYVNFVFNADPQLIAKLRAKFKLDSEVYRQHFQRLKPKSEKTPKKVAAEQ